MRTKEGLDVASLDHSQYERGQDDGVPRILGVLQARHLCMLYNDYLAGGNDAGLCSGLLASVKTAATRNASA